MGFLDNLGLGMGVASDAGNIAGSMVDLFTRKKRREEQFAREDTAVQRRARDLEAAGLSKTLAAGTAAQAQPMNQRSTQTRTQTSGNVLANAQKDLTNAKINESKTQADLNKSAENLNVQRANQVAAQTISEGVSREGQLAQNILTRDKANAIPSERAAFNQLGWSYYKDAPGHLTGEIARTMAAFASGTAGLSRTVTTALQPIVEKIQNIQFPSFEKQNQWIQEQLDKIKDFPETLRPQISNILNGGVPADMGQWQANDRNRNQLPYYQ